MTFRAYGPAVLSRRRALEELALRLILLGVIAGVLLIAVTMLGQPPA